MAGLERLGEGLERVWKGFGNGDGGAWTAEHEVLDKALAHCRRVPCGFTQLTNISVGFGPV